MENTIDFNPDLHSIEDFLWKHNGGRVYLSKEYFNEGIAVIRISNEKKKNAISGK